MCACLPRPALASATSTAAPSSASGKQMPTDTGLLGLRETLDLFPQKEPFLFVDELIEVSLQHAVGQYRFKPDEHFFRGHFPGLPVVPGVIMLEMICQVGQAVFIQHLCKEGALTPEKRLVGYFTDANLELFGKVRPGER